MMNNKHPYVSEAHEGKPVFEWIVLFAVLGGAVLAGLGHTMAATVIFAATATVTGLIRLFLKDRSPWKIRSVGFDTFIGVGLGIGLLVVYFSIQILI
jgi:ABC-type amino acid transport system permease subunit